MKFPHDLFGPSITITLELAHTIMELFDAPCLDKETSSEIDALDFVRIIAEDVLKDEAPIKARVEIPMLFALRDMLATQMIAHDMPMLQYFSTLSDEQFQHLRKFYDEVQIEIDEDPHAVEYLGNDNNAYYIVNSLDVMATHAVMYSIKLKVIFECAKIASNSIGDALAFLEHCQAKGGRVTREAARFAREKLESKFGDLSPKNEHLETSLFLAEYFGHILYTLCGDDEQSTHFMLLDTSHKCHLLGKERKISSAIIITDSHHEFFGKLLVFAEDKRIPPLIVDLPAEYRFMIEEADFLLSMNAAANEITDELCELEPFFGSLPLSSEYKVLTNEDITYNQSLLVLARDYSNMEYFD